MPSLKSPRSLRVVLAGMVLWVVAFAVFAEEPPKGIIGIVTLPKVFGEPNPHGPPGSRLRRGGQPVPVFAEPLHDSRAWPPITSPEGVQRVEYAYEQYGAAVYFKLPGWYQIGLAPDRKGWVRAQDTGVFRSLEQLFAHGLTYFTKHWDGTIHPSADALTAPRAALPAGKVFEGDIRVVATKTIEKDMWLFVELLSPGHCAGADPRPIAKGWIPDRTKSGELTVWFHPRGC